MMVAGPDTADPARRGARQATPAEGLARTHQKIFWEPGCGARQNWLLAVRRWVDQEATVTGRVPMDGFVADTRACCCLRRWSTQVVLDWNQRILRAAEAGDPQGTDQGPPQARRIG